MAFRQAGRGMGGMAADRVWRKDYKRRRTERASERARPENPFPSFQQRANFFSISRSLSLSLSVLPSFLSSPLSFSSSLECRAHSALRDRVAPPPYICHRCTRDGFDEPAFCSGRIAPWSFELGHLASNCNFAPSSARSLRPSPLRGEPFVFVHGRLPLPLLSPSPSAAADLSGSGLARVVGVASLPKQSRAEERRGRR